MVEEPGAELKTVEAAMGERGDVLGHETTENAERTRTLENGR